MNLFLAFLFGCFLLGVFGRTKHRLAFLIAAGTILAVAYLFFEQL